MTDNRVEQARETVIARIKAHSFPLGMSDSRLRTFSERMADDILESLSTSPQATEDDVERVARAICIESGGDPDEDVLPETPRWAGYIPEARAAITAYRKGG